MALNKDQLKAMFAKRKPRLKEIDQITLGLYHTRENVSDKYENEVINPALDYLSELRDKYYKGKKYPKERISDG